MIEIKNIRGEVIHTIDADTLVGANLEGVNFDGTIIRGIKVNEYTKF